MGKILLFPTCCNCRFLSVDQCLCPSGYDIENGHCVSFEAKNTSIEEVNENANT